ncbi:MAG TPA: hypothetical protein VJJ76_03320 [archaeon]|nr:hypothetical protein [archaeon]
MKIEKAQAALEYLMITSIALAVIIPVFYYSFFYSSGSVNYSQALDAVNAIGKGADYVYSLGVGSRTRILVSIPSNVINYTISTKAITYQIRSSSGATSSITAFTKANITGTLPTNPGNYYISLNMTEQGVVISVS